MLLLLKTNDLLRGIETCLGARDSSSAFIYMSKCCVKLIHNYDRQIYNIDQIQANKSIYSPPAIGFNVFSYFYEQIDLFKILMYQWFLIVFNI